jgi:PhnB protein
MAGLIPYVHFDGRAREALTFYRELFGGELSLATFAEFERADGPAEAIAHGVLTGRVDLYGADLADGAPPPRLTGVMFALLGAADPETLQAWFAALSDGGVVVEPLEARPWGAHDGQVRDRFGVTWLIGYEDDDV